MPKVRPSFYSCYLLAFLVVCSLVPSLHGQSSESDLKARLMNNPLYLRGCWRDDYLNFDSAGKLKDISFPVSFTLSGFELQSLHLEQGMLVLEGRRIGLELKDNQQLRVPLNVGKVNQHKDESMRIVIAASPSDDYGAALDTVFANGLAELVPSLPSYWQAYAAKNLLPAGSSTSMTASTTAKTTSQDGTSPSAKQARPGGALKAPKLLHSVDPTFNGAARGLLYGGAVLIHLWVNTDGTPSHLSIDRPVGLGLDERALEAVQKYTFAPATRDGTPVLVELKIEVNFQIF
jgi:TonB family protein